MNKTIYALTISVFCLFQTAARAQWQTTGPYGGDIHCFTVSGASIFAACGNTGIYLSTDSGANWTLVTNTLPANTGFYSLTSINGTVFAGTSNGVYLSTNNGATWSAAGLPGLIVPAVLATSTGVFAYITNQTDTSMLLMTTDNGSTWSNTGLTYGGRVTVLAASGASLYAATDTGVYVSTDTGATWALTLNTGISNTATVALAANGANVIAARYDEGIYFSNDYGLNWVLAGDSGLGASGIDINAFVFSGPVIFAAIEDIAVGGEIYQSIDNGNHWTSVSTGISPLLSIGPLAVSGSNIFAGTIAGVFITTNQGGNWAPVNNGLAGVTIFALAASGSNIFAGGNEAFLTNNNGADWTPVNSGFQGYSGLYFPAVMALATNNTSIFAGTQFGDVYISNNNGTSWTNADGGPLADFIYSLFADGSTIYAGTDINIYISRDNGSTWNGPYLQNLTTAAIGANSASIFAGTVYDGLWVSTDNGNTWAPADSSQLYTSSINAIAVQDSDIYVGSDSGVSISADNGLTWSQSTNGLSANTIVNALLLSGGYLFAGANNGVFMSSDKGASWTAINTGLPNTPISSLAIGGGYIFAGTGNHSVWQRPLSEVTGIQAVSSHLDIKLYPNPNNGSFTLVLPDNLLRMVEITDVTGRIVMASTAVDGQRNFNLQTLSAGIYIMRISQQGEVMSLKFSVVK